MSSVYKDGVIHVTLHEAHNQALLCEDNIIEHILGVILIQQFLLNKGLKLFGKREEKSVTKKLMKLHDMNTYYLLDSETLSREDK